MNLPQGVELKSAAIRGGRRTYVLARPLRIRLGGGGGLGGLEAWRDGGGKANGSREAQTGQPSTPPHPPSLHSPHPPTPSIALTIEVPAGFETDFASIPRLLWPLFPPDGPWLEASIVHDYCYREPVPFSRFFADALFRELMARYGVPRWRRVAFYYAVRLCGWLWWRK